MKRTQKLSWLFAVVFLFFLATHTSAQTLKDVFINSESPILYLGIDFSKSKLIDVGNADDIRNRLYVSINNLIVDEPKKFDLKGAFRKSSINHDFNAIIKSNTKANLNEILSTKYSDFNRFKEADVTAIVKSLNIAGKDGVGLLFVMEAMRKQDKKGDIAVWVTLVDMKTKKVMMTERVVADAKGGFGFRNYWASAIKELIDDIDKKKYKEWRNKFGS